MSGADLYQAVNNMTLEWLYNSVAAKLARRPVTVLWAAIPDARGQVWKERGKYYLQLDPKMDHDQRLRTFLHEAAHLRLHHDKITDTSASQAAPALQDLNPAIKEVIAGIASQREAEAWELAEAWEAAAGEGTITQRLRRLLEIVT
jgi:hypothetical protein